MKGIKSTERSNPSSRSKKVVSKDGLPPIRADSTGGSASASESKPSSRSATPAADPLTSGHILPPIRPVSATRIIDSITRVQLQEQILQEQLRDNLEKPEPEKDDIDKTDRLTEDNPAAANHAVQEPEVQLDTTHDSASDSLLRSNNSQIEPEDPEKEYWRAHSAPPKNSANVAREALKRIQAATASKKVDLSEMDLVSIPDKVFALDDLKAFWAQGNRIEVVPPSIGSLRLLTQLRLFKNRLRWLPAEIGELSALQVIWVQDNMLISLPATIGKLGQLRVLAVARNPLRSFPCELCKCSSLKEVDVEGLDEFLSVPPIDVVRQSIQASFQYLKEYQRRLAWIAETSVLDLSSMGIKASTLPLEVTNMTGLTSLNLSRNAMPALSGSLFHMISLKELDLQECRNLRELSPEVGLMTQLKHIITFQCNLSSPPPEIMSLGVPSLLDYLARIHSARASHELQLNGMELTHTDDAICKISGLVALSLANNKLRDVSPNLAVLVCLQTLDLQGNFLQLLPRELESLTALTDLNVSDNRLSGPVLLGMWIGAWSKLQRINAKQNPDLRCLPLSVACWHCLESLLLDEEQFTQPPMEVLRKGAKATVEYCGKFSDSSGTVSKMQLNGYKFQHYPEEVNQLTSLKSLQIQYNDIKILPPTMTLLVNLRELSVSHNPLVKVPQIVSCFTGLRTLRLDNTLLEEIPGLVGKLKNLKVFSAVQNNILSLPDELGAMVSLTKLNLDSNALRNLPESLGSLSNLQDLSLTRNKIGWLPKSVGMLKKLEDFRIGYNRLRVLPGEIGSLCSLVRLRVGNNALESIPLEIGQITNLEDLSIHSNQITMIPIAIGNLLKLRFINFENNPIKSPREDLLKQGSDAVIEYLKKLYPSAVTSGLELRNASLRHFPLETCTVPALHSLILDDNQLEVLPSELMVLTSLTLLSVQRNMLRKVSNECGMLTSLVRLLLNDNQLSFLPLSLGRAKNLQEIDLQNNQAWITPPPEVVIQGSSIIINYLLQFGDAFVSQCLKLQAMRLTYFPKDVYSFPRLFSPLVASALTAISVAHNKITHLPDDVHMLESIVELDLDENELEDLPASLGSLRNLRKLSFNRNFFSTFPKAVTLCTGLESLKFAGNAIIRLDLGVGQLTCLTELIMDTNQIQEPAPEITAQGCRAIVAYLGQISIAIKSSCLHLPNFKLVSFPPELASRGSQMAPLAANLLEVSLPSNCLEAIPAIMSCLTRMTKLDLSSNMLAKLSVVVGAWQRLRFLDLSSNVIEELPTTIGNFSSLESISLARNKIAWLPPQMSKLVKLKEMYLDTNKLQDLFPDIHQCSALTKLSLSNNLFPCLPYKLARITALRKLVIENNPLSSPPLEVRSSSTNVILDYLRRFDNASTTRYLDLENMGLRAFPLEVAAMTGLRGLNIAGNQIEVLPTVIANLQGLELLKIDNNRLQLLPVELGNICGLKELTFQGNDLRTPPPEILVQGTFSIVEYLKRMLWSRKNKELDLRSLQLRRTPVEVAFMTGLTKLSLASNRLQKIFVGIGQLTLLVELLLDDNEIQTLPLTVGKLTNLTTLSLAHNRVKHLSEWLHTLIPLTSLNVSDNLLQELPFTLLRLTNITYLNVDSNSFPDPPREVVVCGQKRIFRYLTNLQMSQTTNHLDLNTMGLLRFPLLHCSRTALTELNLDNNELQDLPHELINLTNLTSITVRHNRLTRLDLRLGFLSRLETFETEGNDMVTPPPEVCVLGAKFMTTFLYNIRAATESNELILKDMQLRSVPGIVLQQTNITKLDLSGNRIQVLPTQFLYITRLTNLNLDGNLLSQLPEDINFMTDLQLLSLSRNELLELPSTLGDLQRLRVLHVEDNGLKELPPELGISPALEEVLVKGNPLKVPPPEVVRQGTRHMLDYLRRIIDFQRNSLCDLSSTGLADPELPEYVLRQRSLATLLLNDNRLEDLDVGITRLNGLTFLDLGNNLLTRVPPPILALTALKILKLGGNDIDAIPSDIARLRHLRHLSVEANPRMQHLPPTLGLLTELSVLEVLRCPLRSPPPDVIVAGTQAIVDYLGRIYHSGVSGELFLENFDMLSSHADMLDPQVKRLTCLRVLSLASNKLQELDPDLGLRLTNIRELYLRANFFRELPEELVGLAQLQVLHVDQNELRELCPWIRHLTALTDLSASQNQLEYLTEAVGELPGLRRLNLMSNCLVSLPPELCLATSLVALNVDGNPLRSPPPEVAREGRGQILEYLRRLHASLVSCALLLTGMALLHFPVEAQLYTSLTRIDLADNLLEELPRAVGSQPALTDLSAAHNRIRTVDPAVGRLAGLARLHLPFNQLHALPDTVVDIRALTVLNLVENAFEMLDTPICHITSLTDLRLSHNKVAVVGPQVGQLINLRRIHLEHNQLKTLPEEFGGLTALTYLNLAHNRLELLPESFDCVTQLNTLDISANCLRQVLEENTCPCRKGPLPIPLNCIWHIPQDYGADMINLNLRPSQLMTIAAAFALPSSACYQQG